MNAHEFRKYDNPGIESSCDDTAIAILSDDVILASVVSSQNRVHERFGGIVPELASRKHVETITGVLDHALEVSGITINDVDLIAATQGPGLIGSLLVGFAFAKSLSYTLSIPYVGVDHMAAHILSAFLEEQKPSFPYIALIVSGGTTALFRAHSFHEFDLLEEPGTTLPEKPLTRSPDFSGSAIREDLSSHAVLRVRTRRICNCRGPGSTILTISASAA